MKKEYLDRMNKCIKDILISVLTYAWYKNLDKLEIIFTEKEASPLIKLMEDLQKDTIWSLLIQDLEQLIEEIIKERDVLEQKYYRDKIALSVEYETKTAVLLSQKIKLKKILEERLIEKNDI